MLDKWQKYYTHFYFPTACSDLLKVSIYRKRNFRVAV